MTSRNVRVLTCSALSAWLASGAGAALAQTLEEDAAEPAGEAAPNAKAACAAAYEQSQEKRKAGALIQAREQLQICVRDSCPAFVRSECTLWLEEVETSLPTVVLAARRGDQDLDDVRVSKDGVPITEKLTGSAIPLDPGVHVFRFELEGSAPIERRVLVRVGEKNRRVSVTFASEPSADSAPPSAGDAEPDADDRVLGFEKRTVSYAFAGLGAAALGSFAFFALTGKSDENELRERCSPNCPESDIDAVRTKYIVADVSLGVGIASLGVATWFFVSSQKAAKPNDVGRLRPGTRFAVQPTQGGAFLAVTRRF